MHPSPILTTSMRPLGPPHQCHCSRQNVRRPDDEEQSWLISQCQTLWMSLAVTAVEQKVARKARVSSPTTCRQHYPPLGPCLYPKLANTMRLLLYRHTSLIRTQLQSRRIRMPIPLRMTMHPGQRRWKERRGKRNAFPAGREIVLSVTMVGSWMVSSGGIKGEAHLTVSFRMVLAPCQSQDISTQPQVQDQHRAIAGQ